MQIAIIALGRVPDYNNHFSQFSCFPSLRKILFSCHLLVSVVFLPLVPLHFRPHLLSYQSILAPISSRPNPFSFPSLLVPIYSRPHLHSSQFILVPISSCHNLFSFPFSSRLSLYSFPYSPIQILGLILIFCIPICSRLSLPFY